MNKIALTGGNGMIGSAVLAALKSHGHELITLGRSHAARSLDLNEANSITPALFDGCDTLVHCAGIIDEDFKADTAKAFLKGSYAAKKLAEAAYAAGVRNFIYISSAHVYGTLSGSINESTAINPLSDYGISHYATEQIFSRVAAQDSDGHLLILRPCATYGVPADMDRFCRWSLIPYLFPHKVVADGKITLMAGSDKVRRNFVSADAIGTMVAEFLSAPKARKICNAVGAYDASVLEFAELCARIYNDITSGQAEVTMPQGESSFPTSLFYTSQNSAPAAGQSIEDFVKALITILLEKKALS